MKKILEKKASCSLYLFKNSLFSSKINMGELKIQCFPTFFDEFQRTLCDRSNVLDQGEQDSRICPKLRICRLISIRSM